MTTAWPERCVHRAAARRAPRPRPRSRWLVFKHQIDNLRLLDVEIGLGLEHLAHLHPILPLVALRSRRPHRRPARGVQQAELDADSVRNLAHDAAQRIYFAHQVALGDAADGRVARHLRDQVEIEAKQRRAQSHARGRHRRFTARVSCSHYYDIVLFRKSHTGSILELQGDSIGFEGLRGRDL